MVNKSIPSSRHEVPQRVIDGIWSRVDRRSGDQCWPWKLSLGNHGYGQIGWWVNGRTAGTTAHRVVWMAANGPIPDAMTIDHLCRNRPCCNPAHLRLLPNVENAKLNGPAVRDCCERGHHYESGTFSVNRQGWRVCLICKRLRRRGELPELVR